MGWFSSKAKDQKPAAPLTAAEMIKRLPKDARDEFERPDFIINQDIAGCFYFLSVDEEAIRQQIEKPETIPDKGLSERIKAMQPEGPWSKDFVREFLAKRLNDLAALSPEDALVKIRNLADVDMEAAMHSAALILDNPPPAAADKGAEYKSMIYASIRPAVIAKMAKVLTAGQGEEISKTVRQFATLIRQNPDPDNKDWLDALSVVARKDPALAGALALQERSEHPEDRKQALESAVFIQILEPEIREKILDARAVTVDSFRQDLIAELASFALVCAEGDSFPGTWVEKIGPVAVSDWKLAVAVAEKAEETLLQAGKTREAAAASVMALGLKSAAVMKELSLPEDQRAANDSKSDDELEQQLLADLSDYAHKAQEGMIFEMAWPAKIRDVASVDPEIAGQAAKKAFQEAVEKRSRSEPETQEDNDNLQTAFQAALESSVLLAKKRYFHTASEIAYDLYDFASKNEQVPEKTKELLQRNLSTIVTVWQEQMDTNPDEKSRAVAQESIDDFIAGHPTAPPPSFKA